jgi:hypothetical protein
MAEGPTLDACRALLEGQGRQGRNDEMKLR